MFACYERNKKMLGFEQSTGIIPWEKQKYQKNIITVFDYAIEQSKGIHPLFICGLDCIVSFRNNRFFPTILNLLEKLMSNSSDSIQFNSYYKKFHNYIFPDFYESSSDSVFLCNFIQFFQEKVNSKSKNDINIDEKIFIKMLNCLDAYVKNISKFDNSEEMSNFRDSIMSSNLIFFKDSIYKKKAIVWAANQHIMYELNKIENIKVKINSNQVEIPGYTNSVLMGDYLNKVYKEKVYSIAFTSAKVTNLNNDIIKLNNSISPSKSIEHQLLNLKNYYFFIDISNDNNKISLFNDFYYGNFLGNFSLKTRWIKHTDGVFFIKEDYLERF